MEHLNPTLAKIPIMDTRKFEQWKFRIQQYLQNEHYALWEVIKFGDSYEAPKDVVDTEGSEILEQTFNRLQAIISHLEFIDIEIKQDDLNQKFLTSLAPEWLMYTIVWRNRSNLDTMSLDDVYNYLKVYEPEVQKKSESNSQNMAFISLAKNISGNEEVNTTSIPTASTQVSPTSANVATASISLDTVCTYIASQSSGSQIKYKDINQIDEDDIEEMDIMWNMALLSMRADRYWKKTRKKISIQGWDWSYMANEEEDHALLPDQEVPTEFALMAKSSSDTKVFDKSLCSKACKKNTDSLNTKITDFGKKLSDNKTMLYHYKLGLSQVKARLVEFKNQEIKFCEKIRGLEFKVESKTNIIESLTNELEMLKKEKEGLDSKLTDDTITDYSRPSPTIESNISYLIDYEPYWARWLQDYRAPRSQEIGRRENFKQGSKVEESAPKALMAIDRVGWDWSYIANEEEDHALVAEQEALIEFALMAKSSSDNEILDNSLCSKACKKNTDDTITDYSRPSHSIESNSSDLQNSDSSVSKNKESSESIDEDDIEDMDIKWNMALLSMRANRFWKKTGKKISIQGTNVAGFDKSKVKCFNCHKMGHFARECRA
nr:ribonuclease H-like domain-containing protein [Tanacetum cinerariifolium]